MRKTIKVVMFAAALMAATPLLAQPAPAEPIDDLQWLFIEDTVALINPPSEGARQRGRELMDAANVARAEGNNSQMRHLLAEAWVVLKGGVWSPEAAFTASLAIRPHRTVADSAKPVRFEIGQRFTALPPGSGPLVLEVGLREWAARPVTPAPIRWITQTEVLAVDLLDHPALVDLPLRGVADGSYEIVVRSSRDGKTFGTTARRLFVTEHLDRDLANISGRASKLDLPETVKASVLYPADLARTLDNRTRQVRDITFRPLLDRALALLDEAEAGKDSLTGARGDQQRHYWLKASGRYEPYRLVIPDNWDGRAALPLVVMLHGSNGDQNSTLSQGTAIAEAQARGWALLSPMGYAPNGGWGNHLRVMLTNGTAPEPRPSTIDGVVLPRDGVDPEPAEQDVLQTLALVRAEYPIDGRRIYLVGNSMGGEGVWHLASRHPNLWAAVAPAAGAIELEAYPYQRLGKMPVMAVHGDNDVIISYEASKNMIERLKTAGGNGELLTIAGGGHSALHDVTDKVFDFFARHQRREAGRADQD